MASSHEFDQRADIWLDAGDYIRITLPYPEFEVNGHALALELYVHADGTIAFEALDESGEPDEHGRIIGTASRPLWIGDPVRESHEGGV